MNPFSIRTSRTAIHDYQDFVDRVQPYRLPPHTLRPENTSRYTGLRDLAIHYGLYLPYAASWLENPLRLFWELTLFGPPPEFANRVERVLNRSPQAAGTWRMGLRLYEIGEIPIIDWRASHDYFFLERKSILTKDDLWNGQAVALFDSMHCLSVFTNGIDFSKGNLKNWKDSIHPRVGLGLDLDKRGARRSEVRTRAASSIWELSDLILEELPLSNRYGLVINLPPVWEDIGDPTWMRPFPLQAAASAWGGTRPVLWFDPGIERDLPFIDLYKAPATTWKFFPGEDLPPKRYEIPGGLPLHKYDSSTVKVYHIGHYPHVTVRVGYFCPDETRFLSEHRRRHDAEIEPERFTFERERRITSLEE